MTRLPTLHLKLANQMILSMNMSGLTCNEKLDVLKHVHRKIVDNLSPEERQEFAEPPARRTMRSV